MLQRNESADYDGLFQMYTGTDDIQKVKKIPREQKKSELKGVNCMTMGVHCTGWPDIRLERGA